MSDAGVGMFVGRKNNCVFLALVYMRRRGGGTDVFICLALKNTLLGGGKRGCSGGCRRSLSGMPERLSWGQGASQWTLKL